jgi:hypothetical protein
MLAGRAVLALLVCLCVAMPALAKSDSTLGWVDAVPSTMENAGGVLSAVSNARVDKARRRAQGVVKHAAKIEGALQKKLATLLAESVVGQKGGDAKATMDAALAGARSVGDGRAGAAFASAAAARKVAVQRARASMGAHSAPGLFQRVASFFRSVF